jgi:ferric iron reductase protein FhuF
MTTKMSSKVQALNKINDVLLWSDWTQFAYFSVNEFQPLILAQDAGRDHAVVFDRC